jgi:hydroxymethylbilane synthase
MPDADRGHAVVERGVLRFRGLLLRPDGSEALEASATGPIEEAESLGREAGLDVRSRMPPGFLDS